MDDFIIQDNNLSSHRAIIIENVKDLLEIPILPSWPNNSPYVLSIENILVIWKEHGYARKPRDLVELEKIAYSKWENLNPNLFRNLYESIPRRIDLLINVKGSKIKY